MTEFDLGVRCDYFLPLSGGPREVQRDVFMGIKDGTITKIAPFKSAPPKSGWNALHFIHATNQVVMPGLINGHTHLPMVLLKGLADDLPFEKWLNQYILPIESKFVEPNFIRTGTELAALECIRFGVTTVCDMYYHEDVIADVLDQAGMRALVAEAYAGFPTPDDKKQTGECFRIVDRMREKFKSHPRITPCLGPHAPYTCPDDLLKKTVEISAQHDLPIVIHVAESAHETQNSIKHYGKTPVRRLYDLGIMSRKAIFPHSVHISDDDIALMAKTQTAAVYNPESNMKLSCGIAPISKLLQKGVPCSIGTDGAASNNDLNLFREMDVGSKLQKLERPDDGFINAHQMLKMATLGGAKALGIADVTGSLEVGKRADFICVDLTDPHMRPIHDLESTLVYSANGSEVRTVVCDGKILMQDRKFATLDAEAIYTKADEIRDQIQRSVAGNN